MKNRSPLTAHRLPLPEVDAYPFIRVQGDGVHEIAVGPIHAGTIEPGHFRFTANGETHVLVRLGLKAQTIYGLLVKRGDTWVPLFRKAERALLC